MLIFRNNEVFELNRSESSIEGLIIVKSLQELVDKHAKSGYSFRPSYVQDSVGTIRQNVPTDGDRKSFYWGEQVQSPYGGKPDQLGMIGGHETKGEAIAAAWRQGYRVFITKGDVITEITHNGPVTIAPGTALYYTKPPVEPTDQEQQELDMLSAANDVDMGKVHDSPAGTIF